MEIKTYKVPFTRQDYGYVIVKAETAEEAHEKVMSGDYFDDDMFVKGGDTIADGQPTLL